MTNKLEISRELLTILADLNCPYDQLMAAKQRAAEILATPVVERQPVAWLTSDGRQLVFDGVLDQSQYIAHGMQPLYAGAPGPVAVVLPERLTPAELEELEVIEVLLHGQGLSNLAGTMAAARQFIDEVACLDKVKELNQ